MHGDGYDHTLNRRDYGRKHKSPFVTVRHDDSADHAGGSAPGCGVRGFLHAVGVEEFDIERVREILPEVMRRTRLQTLAVVHHGFHAVRSHRAREFFLYRLFARDHGDSKAIFRKFFIHAEHAHRHFFRFFGGGVRGVPFLP